jgi:hypothetical protein
MAPRFGSVRNVVNQLKSRPDFRSLMVFGDSKWLA